MDETIMLLLYAIIFIIGVVVFGFIIFALLTSQGNTIQTIALSGTAILSSIASKGISQGGNILLGALDFVNTIYAQISVTLANIADSFQKVVSTIGVMIRDRIQLVVSTFLLLMNEFQEYVNNVFNLAVIPTFDAIDRVFNLIVQLITNLVGTFNPTTC
jgi:hypothetical protein